MKWFGVVNILILGVGGGWFGINIDVEGFLIFFGVNDIWVGFYVVVIGCGGLV